MSEFYKRIKEGLQQAIEYEKGNLPDVRVHEVTINSVHPYFKEDIKRIRAKHKLTQCQLAIAVGVSDRTVQAWERGANNPSGASCRMLELLEKDDNLLEKYSIMAR